MAIRRLLAKGNQPMFGRTLAKVAAATPYDLKRTFRWLKPAYISVIQLGKPVVPLRPLQARCGDEWTASLHSATSSEPTKSLCSRLFFASSARVASFTTSELTLAFILFFVPCWSGRGYGSRL